MFSLAGIHKPHAAQPDSLDAERSPFDPFDDAHGDGSSGGATS